MKEVEIKAWIHDENEKNISEYLDSLCDFLGEKIKNDTMYHQKNSEKKQLEFRLREEIFFEIHGKQSLEKKNYFVTRKSREYGENGEEINEEIEFEVEDGETFHQFVLALGYEILYKKQKKVWQFQKDDVLIEKVEMKGLGKFLEVEKVCEENEIDASLKKVYAVIESVGLEKSIETKPYGVLLGEL